MPIKKELLEILACPECKTDVTYHQSKSSEYLQCVKCKRKFPIEDGIPNMLPKDQE